MMATQEQLTPTQRRLMAILGDGHPHSKDELRTAIGDEMSVANNLNMHISILRERLSEQGLDVVCNARDGGKYRLVRFFTADDE